MKILHFAPTLHPGSATRLAADLAYSLQGQSGVKCLLVAPRGSQDLAPGGVQHIPHRPYPLLPARWGEVLQLRRIIRTEKPDIVQAYGSAATHTAAKACRCQASRNRPRLIATITGYPDTQAIARAAELAECDSITMLSKNLRRHFKAHNPTLAKSWVIPYGADESLCYPGYSPTAEWISHWQHRYPELTGRFCICLPGPISPRHGTADIVPILSALLRRGVPAHALIAGDEHLAPPAYLAELRHRLHTAGLDAHISWVGAHPEMRDVLTQADAVLHLASAPAAYDRPVLEALALGRPVLGYAHGIIAEYLESFNPQGALPVGDTESAAKVLAQWYNSPPEAPESIPYPYRLSDTAKTYYDLYNSLL